MSQSQPSTNRPMSPHLQVYRWQITMTLSILHRATGVALTFGAFALVAWLAAVAAGPEAFATAQACLHSPVGAVLAFGWSFSLYYHLCNGIRHLVWDAGSGYSMKGLYTGGYIVVAVSVLLTAVTWAVLLGGAA
jgi:succinate dehydrogenase / fumarate reductase cytochrome b subunit